MNSAYLLVYRRTNLKNLSTKQEVLTTMEAEAANSKENSLNSDAVVADKKKKESNLDFNNNTQQQDNKIFTKKLEQNLRDQEAVLDNKNRTPNSPIIKTPSSSKTHLQISIPNFDRPPLTVRLNLKNETLKSVLKENQEIESIRQLRKQMQTKFRVRIAEAGFYPFYDESFDEMTDQVFIHSEKIFKLWVPINYSKLKQIVYESTRPWEIETKTQEVMGVDLAEYYIFLVKKKCGTILHYKRLLDFAQMRFEIEAEQDLDTTTDENLNDTPKSKSKEPAQLSHNSTLLLINKNETSEKFEKFLANQDLSEPVQVRISYKRKTILAFVQQAWGLGDFDRLIRQEISGREFQPEDDESDEHYKDGKPFSFPSEMTIEDFYIEKNDELLSLEVMASTKSLEDIVYHNIEFRYVDKSEMEERHAKRERQIFVIFEKDYDLETKNYEPEVTLDRVLKVHFFICRYSILIC